MKHRVTLYPVCHHSVEVETAGCDALDAVNSAMERADFSTGRLHFADWVSSALVDDLDAGGQPVGDGHAFQMLDGRWVRSDTDVDVRHTKLHAFVSQLSRLCAQGDVDHAGRPVSLDGDDSIAVLSRLIGDARSVLTALSSSEGVK